MNNYLSLWIKTPIATLLGLFLSISLLLNIIFILPLARDIELLIGMLLGFTLWISFLTLLMASRKLWRSVGFSVIALSCSILVNTLFLKVGV